MSGAMEQLYQQLILEHAKTPYRRGLRDGAVAESHQVNPTCGDEVTLRLHLAPGNGDGVGDGGAAPGGGAASGNGVAGEMLGGDAAAEGEVPTSGAVVDSVSWTGQGCSISQASVSVMAGLVEGQTVAEAQRLAGLFRDLMGTRGAGLSEAEEDELGDATAFTGVSRYPARIKCALLGWAALKDTFARAGVIEEDR